MAVRSGEVVWSTTQAGIQMVAAPEAAQPGSSRAVRLAQMRTLARELTASRHELKNGKQEELRLLSQPLYRYERPSSAATDGALFAYCVVWDPEVIVVIESRETKRGPRWYYAPTRFSHLTLTLHHKQKEVWRDTRDGPHHRDPTRGYKLIYGASVQNEVIQ